MALHRDLIVAGASLGGVEALYRIVSRLPADLPAAVLIVLHTGADSPMVMPEILERRTALPVAHAEPNGRIERGRITAAPPGWHTSVVAEGVLGLTRDAPVNHARPAADVLFRSAAQVYARRVIGVVLTGGDHDGTAGLRAIKRAGGVTVVQSPRDAVDPGMPTSAIDGDSPDHVVTLDARPALLVELVMGRQG